MIYPILALLEAVSGRIVHDYWNWTIGAIAILGAAGLARYVFAAQFEGRFENVGDRAVAEFTALTLSQSLVAGVLVAFIIVHYGPSRESALALLFGAGICAGGTSSLAPRPGVHRIFLASVIVPTILGGLLGPGAVELPFLLALLVFSAFLIREGIEAGRAYRALVIGRLELQEAAEEVDSLRGIIPICARCKDVRDGTGYWQKVEAYFASKDHVSFSHGLCPKCLDADFPKTDPEPSGVF